MSEQHQHIEKIVNVPANQTEFIPIYEIDCNPLTMRLENMQITCLDAYAQCVWVGLRGNGQSILYPVNIPAESKGSVFPFGPYRLQRGSMGIKYPDSIAEDTKMVFYAKNSHTTSIEISLLVSILFRKSN